MTPARKAEDVERNRIHHGIATATISTAWTTKFLPELLPMPPRVFLRSHFVCQACRQSVRRHAGTRFLSRSSARHAQSEDIDDYYALLLNHPLPTSAVTQRPLNTPPIPDSSATSSVAPTTANISSAKDPRADVESRARVVFGSRLAGPVERAKRRVERDAQATILAGVRIPPRPSEPDNCCMSGCVNCVWDLYREELEEWAEKRQEAEMKLHGGGVGDAGRQKVTGGGMGQAALSMDDDGGGSETNWDSFDARLPKGKGLFDSVPVGIREFMKTEKRLGRKRQEREKAAQGS